jgi:hypothetical protein
MNFKFTFNMSVNMSVNVKAKNNPKLEITFVISCRPTLFLYIAFLLLYLEYHGVNHENFALWR